MADFCRDCTLETFGPDVPEGAHDFPAGTYWLLCEGCGVHLFRDGQRACRSGPWVPNHATIEPCPECVVIAKAELP